LKQFPVENEATAKLSSMEYESEIISLLSALRPSLVDTIPKEIEVKTLTLKHF
jgi:hypothetical protein